MIGRLFGVSLGLAVLFIVVYLGVRWFGSPAQADQMARDLMGLLDVVGTWVLDGLGDLRRTISE